MAAPAFRHQPVMAEEIAALFGEVPAGLVVDATVGGGGHAARLLAEHASLRVLGLDRDGDALAAAAERLAPFGDRARLVHARFDRIAEVTGSPDVAAWSGPVTGVLFDLGVSSWQLDAPERGFSYRTDAPLDMRMDRSGGRSAVDVVNGYAEADLARVLRRLGDERFAWRVARAVVAARPVPTTGELADVVRDAIPAAARRTGGHPARRSFQAIRIEVNAELEVLPGAVDQALELLAPRGRCAVLAYHSGEDRIVKDRFRRAVTGGVEPPPGLPPPPGVTRTARPVGVPRTPSPAQAAANRRAESARLRVDEKLPAEGSP